MDKHSTSENLDELILKTSFPIVLAPLRVIVCFLMYMLYSYKKLLKHLVRFRVLSTSIVVAIAACTLFVSSLCEDFFGCFMWYGKWFVLGVMSSVGFGFGAHTFLLFLGPLVAEVTTFSYACKSLSFDIFGNNRFICSKEEQDVNVLSIYMKIFIEVFLWGAGTAFGELPPFILAKATRGDSEDGSKSKVYSYMTFIIRKFGFFGILLCASTPNPLFDVAGVICGYFGVSFTKFFLATFIDRNIKRIISAISNINESAAENVSQFVMEYKHNLLNVSDKQDSGKFGTFWRIFLFALIFIFVMSIVQSLAKSYIRLKIRYKERKEESLTK